MHRVASRIALGIGCAVWVAASACGDNVGATGLPGLSELRVSGSAAPMYPDFESARLRYGVRLAATGGINLHVEPADSRSVVRVDGAVAGGRVPLDAEAGDVVDIEVTSVDGEVVSYELIVLPLDFPDLEVTVLDPDRVSSDPIFVGLRGSAYFNAILDNRGVPLYFRREPAPVFDFKRHPSGEYSYAIRTPQANEFGRSNNEIVVLDESFNEIDRVQTVGLNHTDNHDFIIRENGNYVLLAYHGSLRDMTAFGLSDSELVEDSVVQEITRDREIVFEWSSFGNIPFDHRLRPSSDYAHANSIVYDTDGNLILSARAVSRIIKIDTQTGEILWNLGGRDNDFTYVDDPFSNICGQHTASRLDNGNILLFDNGQLCFPEHPDRVELTRVSEYKLDESAMTAQLVWSYSRPGAYTRSQGSSQRLDNGNTIIGWGRGPAVLATEVDAAGEIVFELVATEPGEEPLSYRAVRYPMP